MVASRLSALSFVLRRSSASAVFLETLMVVVSFNFSARKHMRIHIYKYTFLGALKKHA